MIDAALRPMSTSQVLDRTFSLYRHNFVLFAGIAILPPGLMLIGELLMLAATRGIMFGNFPAGPDPTQAWGIATFALGGLAYLGFMVLALLGYAFASGATVYGVSKLHLGNRTTISEAYRQIRVYFGRILGIVVLVGLCWVVLVAVAMAIIFVPIAITAARGGRGGFGAALVIGVFLGFLAIVAVVIGTIYVSAKFALAVPSCVIENLGVIDSMKRSWNLTHGTFWRLVLVFILTGIMRSVVSLVLSIPYFIGIGMMVVKKDPSILMPFLIWQYVAGFLAGTLSFPISTIAASLIYYDQRVRNEAFDLQMMMDALGPPVPPPLANPAIPGVG